MCDACLAECQRIDLLTACRRCGHPHAGAPRACHRCAQWPSTLSAGRAVFTFGGPVREAVHRLKYQHEHARAEWCAGHLVETLDALGWQPDVLVPVPLHVARQRERGYNQSQKLAEQMARRTGIPLHVKLVRQRPTRPQVTLTAEERAANVAGAFVARERLDGQSVLLIDDVLTTGATLNDCARACRAAGAAVVGALTFSSG
jgi:ComF family protein